MNDENKISKATLETVARRFFKESHEYGFKQVDYVRFVNLLLDLFMNQQSKHQSSSPKKKIHIKSKAMVLPIQGDHILIRNCHSESDKQLLENWLNDEYGRNFLLSRTTALECELDSFITDPLNIIGIIILSDNKPVGAVAYLDYDQRQHKAELRKLIGEPSMRGKGYAKEATQLWIQYGFSTLGLKKIYLNTLNTNIRNIQLNEELGFKVEGILRNEVLIEGVYQDVLRMGLCFE